MKKWIAIALAVVVAVTMGSTAVFAGGDQIPAAKSAFASDNVYAATAGKAQSETEWFEVLNTKVKTGEPKDLTIDVSAETSLTTSAKISGTSGSEALAEIMIRVVLDPDETGEGIVAVPGEITFDNRTLKVTGDLSHHYAGEPLPIDDHWIEVFIDTKSAHAFNFGFEDVGSGVHTISIQAKLKKVELGEKAVATVAIGNMSVVVDEVTLKRVD